MSAYDYIIQFELIRNIKRLLNGSGYLYDILVPTIKEDDNDSEYNEKLFMIEHDIKSFLNSNDPNLKAVWIDKYLERKNKFDIDE